MPENAMTLLREIQNAATDESVSLGTLLRKALMLGSRLSYEPLVQWVKFQLDGYPDDAELPQYRAWRPCQALGNFSGGFGSAIHNQPLPSFAIDERLHRNLFGFELRDGIATYQQLLDRGQEGIGLAWPQNLVAAYQDEFYEAFSLAAARRVITLADLRQVIESVRTRLLTFALELEATDPDAGGDKDGASEVDRTTLDRAFNVTVMGSGNIVNVAARDATQHTSIEATTGWRDLRRELERLGLEDQDLGDLAAALEGDQALDLPHGTMGPATTRWYQTIMRKVEHGTIRLGGEVGVAAIAAELLKFLGIQ